MKLVLLVVVAVFMAGSLICALAHTIQLLIFGRVIAGAGGGGIYVAVTVLSILAEGRPTCSVVFSYAAKRGELAVYCSLGQKAGIFGLFWQCHWAPPRRRFLGYVSI